MANHNLKVSPRFRTDVNLAIARRTTGEARIDGTPNTNVDNTTRIGSLVSTDDGLTMSEDLNGQAVYKDDDRPFMQGDDPFAESIRKRGVKKWKRILNRVAFYWLHRSQLLDKSLPLSARLVMFKAHRELTSGELSEIRENIERKKLAAFHKERAIRGKNIMINSLTNLRKARIVTSNGREVVKNKVRFDRIGYSPLVYRYHVDAQRSPVNIAELFNDDVCTHLSASVEHPVRASIQRFGGFVTGLWYEIEIAATLGIPNKCNFSDLLPLMPDSAPPLAFLLGYGENKRPEWRSLEDMPHLLGGGQTNGGKSNMMHVMLCTMIARNKPDDVKFVLIDMKFDGIELSRYEGLPHLITEEIHLPAKKKKKGKDEEPADDEIVEDGERVIRNGIASNAEQGVAVLRWIVAEGKRRGKMFKEEKVQNLKLWNRRHHARHLAEIVVFIDELALLRLDPQWGDGVYKLIQEISSTARASGIHLVAFTQSSNRRIVDEMIKVNFPGRICFSVPDSSSSILFVGDGSAQNLTPAGRAYYKFGTDNKLIQTPLIEPYNVSEIIENARKGQTTQTLKINSLTPEEIIEWAIEENGSSVSKRDVYNKFGQQRGMEQTAIERLLAGMEGNIFVIGDRNYQVLPGAGQRPRIVVRIPTDMVPPEQNSAATPQATIADDVELCPHCGAIRKENPCEWCGVA